MLKLLADVMMFILKAPFKILAWINMFVIQRSASARVTQVAGKELKPLSKVGKFLRGFFLVVLWLLLVAFFVAIFWGLWWLNGALGLERMLGGPLPRLRPFWLPLLFLLFCVACIVGYRLYRALGPDRELIEFADIEDAWTQARAALVDAGIDLGEAPLFLVLGRPASNPSALMNAAGLPMDVQQIPLIANPALQVYASKRGIFVLALDACLLGRQAELLYEATDTTPEVVTRSRHTVFEEPPTPEPADSAPLLTPAPDPLLATQNLLAEPTTSVLTAPASPQAPWTTTDGRRRMPALQNRADEMDKYQRRLRYLARRIARDREPFCALNGVLVLLPFAALEADEEASQIASLCESDLRTLHDTARTRCPLVVLVTDLETAPGFSALRDRLESDRRVRLFGQDLPLAPDVKPEEVPVMLTSSLQHFVRALGQWGVRLFRVEESARDDAAKVSAANTLLFELLESIRCRERGLARILTRIRCGETPLEFMLGGFYLAATGADPARDQAFVPGVFQQLLQSQNAVAWTDAALAEEADYQRWTVYGYAALALFCITVAVLLWIRWQVLRW